MSAITGSEDPCLSITDILDSANHDEVETGLVPHFISCPACRDKILQARQWFARQKSAEADKRAKEQAILDVMR